LPKEPLQKSSKVQVVHTSAAARLLIADKAKIAIANKVIFILSVHPIFSAPFLCAVQRLLSEPGKTFSSVKAVEGRFMLPHMHNAAYYANCYFICQ